MTTLEDLVARNQEYAATAHVPGPIPRQPLFLLTCLDPRTDPASFLGLRHGDAPVLRNAGGRVTPAVIADLAFIGELSGVLAGDDAGPLFDVVIIHHTQCGTGLLADEGFRRTFADRTGYDETELVAEAVIDPYLTVRHDVALVLAAPQISTRVSVSGYVYDLASGLINSVVESSSLRP